MILLILLLIYIPGLYGAYKYVQTDHFGPDGRYTDMSPDLADLIMVLTPILNYWLCLSWIFDPPSSEAQRLGITPGDKFLEWLFKPRMINKEKLTDFLGTLLFVVGVPIVALTIAVQYLTNKIKAFKWRHLYRKY